MAKAKTKKENVSQETKSEGVILIAHGHPMYAHYAYNLAVGLKFVSPDVSISVITSGNCLSQLEPEQLAIFNNIIQAKTGWVEQNGQNYFLSKLYLDKASPYDKTLYLDVDLAWNPRRKVNEIFSLLDGLEFQCIAFEEINCATHEQRLGDWLDYKEFHTQYGIEKTYLLSSELMYFEKGTTVFENARKVYKENKLKICIKTKIGDIQTFAGVRPDEPYFSAGLSLSKLKLKLNPFTPTYWQGRFFTQILKDEYILENYFAVSAGGNTNTVNTIRLYNNMTSSSFDGSGVKRIPYKLQHKRNVLKKERQLL